MHLVQLERENGLTLDVNLPKEFISFIHSFPIKALGGEIWVIFTLVNICIVHHIFHYLQLCWLQNTREIRKHFCLAFPTQVASTPRRCLFYQKRWTRLFTAAVTLGPPLEQVLIWGLQIIQITAVPVLHALVIATSYQLDRKPIHSSLGVKSLIWLSLRCLALKSKMTLMLLCSYFHHSKRQKNLYYFHSIKGQKKHLQQWYAKCYTYNSPIKLFWSLDR